MIIDMHTHIVPEEFPTGEGRPSGDRWPRMQPNAEGGSTMVVGGKNFRVFKDVCWNPAHRAADLSRLGTDKQVLSPLPELLMYNLEPQDGADMARHMNETIAAMVRAEPERFYGMGTVPLQDVEMAVAEVGYIKSLGLHGVEIRSNVEGKNLGDAGFRPFFKEAESLRLAVFVHAYNPTFKDRLPGIPPEVANAGIGFPAENALAGASLIWDGVLADCPDLRICMSHGGGSLVHLLARSNDNYLRRKEVRELLPESPMDYARRMYYDNITFSLHNMRFLLDSVGATQVVVGTDYSGQSVKELTPGEELDLLGLTPAEREAVSAENALRFLGVE